MPPSTDDSASRFCGGTLRRLSSNAAIGAASGSAERTTPAERKLFCYARVKEYVSKSKKNIRAREKFLLAFRGKLYGQKTRPKNLSTNTPASRGLITACKHFMHRPRAAPLCAQQNDRR